MWDVLSGVAKTAWDVMSGGTKTAWDVMSGVTKRAWDVLSGWPIFVGCFVWDGKKWHGMFCPGMFCPAPTQNINTISMKGEKFYQLNVTQRQLLRPRNNLLKTKLYFRKFANHLMTNIIIRHLSEHILRVGVGIARRSSMVRLKTRARACVRACVRVCKYTFFM